MTEPDHPSARATVATVAATAAVTVAIGVTAAALGGYLTLPRTGGSREVGTVAPAAAFEGALDAQAAVSESTVSAPTPQGVSPRVVLVPIVRDAQRETAADPPGQRELEPLFAVYEPSEHERVDDDHHRRSEHHHRPHEHDDDDD